MRPIWNGMLSFGLVNIRVGIYPATEDTDLHMHLLHKEDSGRIKNQRVCSIDGKPVAYDDLVKGYEYEKGRFVMLTDEDLHKIKPEATEKIVIDDFVDAAEIDPKFNEKPYFLIPGKKSEQPYVLLREALKKSGKVGIARIVIRTKERLAAVRVDGPALMLDTMHFVDELREAEGLPSDSVTVGKRELDMALLLIQAMSTKFNPNNYHDTYNEALQEMISNKVKGQEIVQPESNAEPTQIIDLMEYLKASIEKTGKSTQPQPGAKADTKSEADGNEKPVPKRRSKTA